MRKAILVLIIFLFQCPIIFGQNNQDLNIDFMLRAKIHAKSSIKDSMAFGGFGSSDNLPEKINDNLKFSESGLFLKIDTTKIIIIDGKFSGYNFYIGNKSDTIVKLGASDSRLSIIAEVFYENKWQPIEYLPSSGCGNSYHSVYLKQNEYWVFNIPKFSGKIKTKMRYQLFIGKDKFIYSNEILTSFNKKQLTNKEGHQPNGLMDSYND